MLLGAHLSISNGFCNACIRAGKLNCQALQIFTKNQLQWSVNDISQKDVSLFKKELINNKIQVTIAHASYLINLASTEKKIYKKSFELFVKEIKRCEALGIHFYVIHPGSPKCNNVNNAINKISNSISDCIDLLQNSKVQILLETTAGQGFIIK